jgi:hypothetical protein
MTPSRYYLVITNNDKTQNIEIFEDIVSTSLYLTEQIADYWDGEQDDLDYLTALKKVSVRQLYSQGGTTKIEFLKLNLYCSYIVQT